MAIANIPRPANSKRGKSIPLRIRECHSFVVIANYCNVTLATFAPMPPIVLYRAASITLTALTPKLAAVGAAPLASCKVIVATSPAWVTPADIGLASVTYGEFPSAFVFTKPCHAPKYPTRGCPYKKNW